ncbi:MAG: redoxin domain-containing protein [Deltaproteobacteria bacterium]|nr:redoxin domain-containing protein [Deltaproteobacteria bacterium]
MPNKRKYLFVVVGILVLAWVVYLFYREGSREPIELGKVAPDFELASLSNQTYRLSSLRGKVLLLNFWATWCGPCKEEMPALERLYQSLKGEGGFELLAVSVDRTGREDVEPFVQEQKITFPVLLDSLTRVSELYQVYKLPETFLIDGEGKIVEHYQGPREWDSPLYEQMIRQLIIRANPSRFGSLELIPKVYAAEIKESNILEEPTDNEGHARAWWQERVSSLNTKIAEVEAKTRETEAKIHSLPADARILEVRSEQQKLQELLQKKKDLQKQLVDLEEEARRAGAPPGWLRFK